MYYFVFFSSVISEVFILTAASLYGHATLKSTSLCRNQSYLKLDPLPTVYF